MTNNFTRRNFIQTAAGAAGLALATKTIALPEPAYAQEWAAGPNGTLVNFGIIGIGMQGSGLLKTAVELPGAKCVAACDLWDGRQTLAKEIAGPDIAVHAQVPGAPRQHRHPGAHHRRARPLAQADRG